MDRKSRSLLIALAAVVILGGARWSSHAAATKGVNTAISQQPVCDHMMLAADTKTAMSCVPDGTCPACKTGQIAARCTYAGNIKVCVCLPDPSTIAK